MIVKIKIPCEYYTNTFLQFENDGDSECIVTITSDCPEESVLERTIVKFDDLKKAIDKLAP